MSSQKNKIYQLNSVEKQEVKKIKKGLKNISYKEKENIAKNSIYDLQLHALFECADQDCDNQIIDLICLNTNTHMATLDLIARRYFGSSLCKNPRVPSNIIELSFNKHMKAGFEEEVITVIKQLLAHPNTPDTVWKKIIKSCKYYSYNLSITSFWKKLILHPNISASTLQDIKHLDENDNSLVNLSTTNKKLLEKELSRRLLPQSSKIPCQQCLLAL